MKTASRKILAAHSSSRSGYARDIMPERVDADERLGAVPPATLAGGQLGRPTPAAKQYTPGIHKIVSLDEAMANMNARIKGKIPQIGQGAKFQSKNGKATRTAPEEAETINDPYPDAPESAGYDGMTPVPEDDQEAYRTPRILNFKPTGPAGPVATTMSRTDQYLKQRKRITLELADSTVSMSVVDIIPSRYAVTLFLPMTQDGGIVIPKPGSELTIINGATSYQVYYPGAQFESEDLQLVGLTFIRTEEGNQ